MGKKPVGLAFQKPNDPIWAKPRSGGIINVAATRLDIQSNPVYY